VKLASWVKTASKLRALVDSWPDEDEVEDTLPRDAQIARLQIINLAREITAMEEY
jgi:hypothetical protein